MCQFMELNIIKLLLTNSLEIIKIISELNVAESE